MPALKALNDKTQGKRGQISTSRALIAPIHGWYVGSPMAGAPTATAFLLENAFPEYDYVRARGGALPWATGMTGKIVALMPYTNGVVAYLFAYDSAGSIFDASVAGAVGAAKVTGLTHAVDVVYCQYSGTGPQTLIVANGVDTLQFFDGTTWSTGAPLLWTFGAATATGTITFTVNPASNSNITLNGTIVTFSNTPGTNVVPIGGNLAETLASLMSFLNHSTDVQIVKCTYSASATVLTITYVGAGVIGNSFGIAAGTAPATNGTVSAATLTGGTAGAMPSPISFVWEYNQRMYGIAAGTTDVYYPAVDAIGGPTTIFPMGPLLRYGGQLLAGGTWNQLTSNGVLYQWFVISTEGEVVLFNGLFPGDPAWKQTGCYKIGRPLGIHCINTVGGDASIMTEDGIVALSQVIQIDEAGLFNKSLTAPIAPAWKDAVQARITQKGWQMTLWPVRYMAIVNLPQLTLPNVQFVANERTGYWCRFTGWDAQCFAVHGLTVSELYFGTSDGRTMKAENGGMDDGKAYTMTVFYSYSGIGSLDVGSISTGTAGEIQPVSSTQAVARKKITMIRARFQTNIPAVTPTITVNVDYDVTTPSAPGATGSVPAGSVWDNAKWDIDKWTGPIFSQSQNWVPVYAMASAIAPIVQVTFKSAATPDVRLTNVDVLFETGNIFG